MFQICGFYASWIIEKAVASNYYGYNARVAGPTGTESTIANDDKWQGSMPGKQA